MARAIRPAVESTTPTATDPVPAPEPAPTPMPEREPDGGYVIATAALHVPGGARAHRAGDRVPRGNVERNGWTRSVREPAAGE